MTRAMVLLASIALLASGCDELVEQVPAEHQAWPTAELAATAICSQQCRWARECLPTDEADASCAATCTAFLTSAYPEAAPTGTDAQIDACVRELYSYTQAPGACWLAAPPMLSACLDLARPESN